MSAERYNDGKLEWSLLDYESLTPLVEVMMYGCHKYTRDNWKKGFPKEKLIDSLLRHALALADGEEIDPENNIHHIGGIMFNAMAYYHQEVLKKTIKQEDNLSLLK
jgi:hypothetical protein